MKNVLTIAGSDSGGGAGIQADLKTFSAHETFGMSVITAITAQNTQGVFGIQDLSLDIIEKQIDAIFSDFEVSAVKIGMTSRIETINLIAKKMKEYSVKHVVLDPVMVSKTGFSLISEDAKRVLINTLIPVSTIITPNIFEGSAILGGNIKINSLEIMLDSVEKIHKLGAKRVCLKGGINIPEAPDVYYDGLTKDKTVLKIKQIQNGCDHGSGCSFSSAIAANLAKGMSYMEAVSNAKEYITVTMDNGFKPGKGIGVVNHFYFMKNIRK
jgi:hydroxymethylpyrimidine/phosphomethylpyrimidine kinase